MHQIYSSKSKTSTMTITKCTAINAGNGNRCKKTALTGQEFCAVHLKKREDIVSDMEQEPTNQVLIPPATAMPTDDMTDLIARLEKLETKLTNIAVVKKERTAKTLTKAKLLFYHDVKQHEEILAELIRRGVPMVEKKKKDTTVFVYPWWEVKRVTDDAFKNLDMERRKQYIDLAKI